MYFINTSRGGVLVEPALRDALESGHLSGAGIDVLTIEPTITESNEKLIKMINAKTARYLMKTLLNIRFSFHYVSFSIL